MDEGMTKVYLEDQHPWQYILWVNGERITSFASTERLSQREIRDIEDGYREAYSEKEV